MEATSQRPLRLLYWALPPMMAALFWTIGLFLPDHHVNWVMIQAVLLSSPPFWFLIWPFWAIALAFRWRRHFVWLLALTPWWIGLPDFFRDQPGGGLVLVAANVNAYTGEVQTIERELANEMADILITVEKRPLFIEGMHLAAHNFDDEVERPSHYSAVFCREPCVATVSPEYGSSTMKMPIASIRLPQRVCILGVHSPPPAPIDATGMHPYIEVLVDNIENGQMKNDFGVCELGDDVLIIGDLNAVPGSWAYRELLRDGLSDRRAHSGLFGLTWPSGGDWIDFPLMRLDHLLVGDVSISRVRRIHVPDSDHMGLKVWLQSD